MHPKHLLSFIEKTLSSTPFNLLYAAVNQETFDIKKKYSLIIISQIILPREPRPCVNGNS
jgi:hypothetical protein